MKVFDKIILARKVADDARSKINEVTGLLKECYIECDKCAALNSGAQPPQADNSAMVPCPFHDTVDHVCYLVLHNSCGDVPCQIMARHQ
jgi:hypothetical protein